MSTVDARIRIIQIRSNMSDGHRKTLTGYVSKLVELTGKPRPFIYGGLEDSSVLVLEWAHHIDARFQVEVDVFAERLESITYIVDMLGNEDQKRTIPINAPELVAALIGAYL